MMKKMLIGKLIIAIATTYTPQQELTEDEKDRCYKDFSPLSQKVGENELVTVGGDRRKNSGFVSRDKPQPKEIQCFSAEPIFHLHSLRVYTYMCGRSNSTYYGEMDRHLNVRCGEHIGISPLTFKKTKSQFTTIFSTAIISCRLRNLSFLQMEIINSFLKSNKAC